MKTKHKVFSLIMAVLLVLPAMFVLTACGGENNDNEKHRETTAWFTSE